MKLAALIDVLHTIAPLEYAAEWDNCGLLAGSSSWNVDKVLLTIDLTEPVFNEALSAGVQAIIAYHPPIFSPLRSVTDRSPMEQLVMESLRAGIALYSPHTALDAAPGGVNDWLADGLGDGDVRALEPQDVLPESEQCKVVTFCPVDSVDRIRQALASIGAGRIGAYEQCSFTIPGTGTFYGSDDASPTIGKAGVLQHVDEVRLEMVCSRASLALAVTVLRQFHPYEEPPIEIYPLLPRPSRGTGMGRRVVLDRKASLKEIVDRVKSHLQIRDVRVAVGRSRSGKYQTIGLCAGAGGSLAQTAIDQDCQMYFTGEMRHHDVLAAQARGCTVVLAGHSNTERGYLKVLRQRIRRNLPKLNVLVSRRDAPPMKMM